MNQATGLVLRFPGAEGVVLVSATVAVCDGASEDVVADVVVDVVVEPVVAVETVPVVSVCTGRGAGRGLRSWPGTTTSAEARSAHEATAKAAIHLFIGTRSIRA